MEVVLKKPIKYSREEKAVKDQPKKYSWLTFSKIVAVLGIVLSILGVLYQRGIFSAAGMGNLEVNTTVQEVIYYGYEAIVIIASLALSNINAVIKESYQGLWYVSICFSLLCIVFVFVFRNFTTIKAKAKKIKLENKLKKHIGSRYLYLTAGIGGIAICFIVNALFILGFYLLVVIPAIPGAVALTIGSKYVDSIMRESPYCISYKTNEEFKKNLNKYGDIIKTCTKITIKDRTFVGRLLLTNKEGYLIALNHSFVYISKDASQCFYTYFEKKSSIKSKLEKPELYEFPRNIELEKVCKKADVIR